MGHRGPPPKPTAIRELEGNPGKRPLNKFEPRPPKISTVAPPEWLSDIGKLYWARLVPMLSRMGVLTEADLPLLERYCDALSDWHSYREFLSKNRTNGYPVYDYQRKTFDKDGKPIVAISHVQLFPHGARKLRLSEHLLRIEQHFGMTPAARSRILVGEDAPPIIPDAGAGAEEYDPFEVN